MNLRPLAFPLLLAVAGAVGHEPLPDGARRISALVVADAPGKSIALVIRPESASSLPMPTQVAALRAAMAEALAAADVKLVDGASAADRALRDMAGVGLPPAPALRAAATAAGAEALLCLVVRRAGDVDAVTAHVVADGRAIGQLALRIDAKSMIPAGGQTDLDAAAASLAADLAPAVARCAADAAAANISAVQLSVRPESTADGSTPGFELGLYDAIARSAADAHLTVTTFVTPAGRGSAQRPVGPLSPAAVAKLRDLPSGAAVMAATYARRPGGRVVKLAIVGPGKPIAAASAAIDEWDAAVFPLYPVLNVRVLAYAEAQVGKKVGNGECWTLAADALVDARAHPANGYTFGRKLAPGETPYPGDIFQFTSARFEGHNGGYSWYKTLGDPNHTAVLRRVLGPTKFEILEQNPGPVKTDTIDFKDLKSGSWELWRPQG